MSDEEKSPEKSEKPEITEAQIKEGIESVAAQEGFTFNYRPEAMKIINKKVKESGEVPHIQMLESLVRLSDAYRSADHKHSKTVSVKPSEDSDERLAIHTVDAAMKNPAFKDHRDKFKELVRFDADISQARNDDVTIEGTDTRRIITVHRKNAEGKFELVRAFGGNVEIELKARNRFADGYFKYWDEYPENAEIKLDRTYNPDVGNVDDLGSQNDPRGNFKNPSRPVLSLPLRRISEAENGGWFEPDPSDVKNFLRKVEDYNLTQSIPEGVRSQAIAAAVLRAPEKLPQFTAADKEKSLLTVA